MANSIFLTAWWMATILGLWRSQPFSFVELFIGFVLITLAVAGVLEWIRRRIVSQRRM